MLAARTYAAGRDYPAAEKVLRQALEVDPSSLGAYGMLGQLYIAQGKLDQARVEFENFAKKQPTSVAAHTMIGLLLQAQGKRPEAMKKYDEVLRLDPRAAVAANNLAWMYAEDNVRLDEALQLAQAAQQQLPDSPEVSDTLGWVYFKKGMYPQAITPLTLSVEKDPNNPEYQFRLGMSYVKAGQWAQGRPYLERALKLKPDFPGADEAKKTLAMVGTS
jgi:Tfp pilus assembly protein PilF